MQHGGGGGVGILVLGVKKEGRVSTRTGVLFVPLSVFTTFDHNKSVQEHPRMGGVPKVSK